MRFAALAFCLLVTGLFAGWSSPTLAQSTYKPPALKDDYRKKATADIPKYDKLRLRFSEPKTCGNAQTGSLEMFANPGFATAAGYSAARESFMRGHENVMARRRKDTALFQNARRTIETEARRYDAICRQRGAAGQHKECFNRWLGLGKNKRLETMSEDEKLLERDSIGFHLQETTWNLQYDSWYIHHGGLLNKPAPEIMRELDAMQARYDRLKADSLLWQDSPYYDYFLADIHRVEYDCLDVVRAMVFEWSVTSLSKTAAAATTSTQIETLMTPYRPNAYVRAYLSQPTLTKLEGIDQRLKTLRQKESEAARLAWEQQQARARAEAEKRRQEALAAAQAETKRLTVLRAERERQAASTTGIAAPRPEDMIRAEVESMVRYRSYDYGPNWDEIAETNVLFGGASYYKRISAYDATCVRQQRNRYDCTYTIAYDRRTRNDGSAVSAVGNFMSEYFGSNILQSHFQVPARRVRHTFVYEKGWYSPTLDRAIDTMVQKLNSSTSTASSKPVYGYQMSMDMTDMMNPKPTYEYEPLR